MKILRAEVSRVKIPLKAPFTIAFHTTCDAELIVLQLITDGPHVGYGTAAPFEEVTGESLEACHHALAETLPEWIIGREFEHPSGWCHEAAPRFKTTPAARAAIDMALYDLWGKMYDKPVVDLLGRVHGPMPTSMTMGIRTMDESLDEAREFLGMGYTILKVKGGSNLDHDVELLKKLREEHGNEIGLRSDLNQGYDKATLTAFIEQTQTLNIEMIEQPFPVDAIDDQLEFSEEIRAIIAVDENACNEHDALRLAAHPQPANIINIKLMKCGGIYPASRMAAIADVAGQTLMWGCMIESVVGLSAALHIALASPSTRFLDLDGSYDLVEDVFDGGMRIEKGVLHTMERPGLGVTLHG
ncbi:MAG: dipeptide epimerase [Candidatus Hydrogenedentota bacterium]|nr:MAG: dipeptide epimerase [Candidatus Hydrogenedentota bacterium]